MFIFIYRSSRKECSIRFTYMITGCNGRTYTCICFNTCCDYVTAGVFLVIRCSYLFEQNENILIVVGVIGGLTCLFSAIIGSFQFDIKKIVAYSTASQLGYMFFSSGMSNYSLSLFHLFNHAFFKALLFLSMGSIIHALSDDKILEKWVD